MQETNQMELVFQGMDCIMQELANFQSEFAKLQKTVTESAEPVAVDMKQMDLETFAKVYGIPRETAIKWAQDQKKTKFPAFKLFHKWYVDIPKYKKWRNTTHVNNFPYASLEVIK